MSATLKLAHKAIGVEARRGTFNHNLGMDRHTAKGDD